MNSGFGLTIMLTTPHFCRPVSYTDIEQEVGGNQVRVISLTLDMSVIVFSVLLARVNSGGRGKFIAGFGH